MSKRFDCSDEKCAIAMRELRAGYDFVCAGEKELEKDRAKIDKDICDLERAFDELRKDVKRLEAVERNLVCGLTEVEKGIQDFEQCLRRRGDDDFDRDDDCR